MKSFTIMIAGMVFQIQHLFESTRDYCREYLTDLEQKYHITVKQEDLTREQELLRLEALEEGLKVRRFGDPFLERSVIQRRIAEMLVEKDTILMHGSTIAVDGQAYLFTASCGTGKSTHTRLWREVFGSRAVMVNDDKPFLQIHDQGVLAYGSPWSGKHGLANHICVPLKGICILKRGPMNRIRRIGSAEAVLMLRHQCFLPEGEGERVNQLVDRLMELVPLWEMECTKEPQAALVAYEAMSAETIS